jgi:transcriptional regulator with XRE-family HTH domain
MNDSATEPGWTDRLRQALRASKFSQHELAKKSGVGQAQISRFLSGDASISLTAFEKLCGVVRLRLVQEPEQESAEAPPGAEAAPPPNTVEEQPQQKPRGKRKRGGG